MILVQTIIGVLTGYWAYGYDAWVTEFSYFAWFLAIYSAVFGVIAMRSFSKACNIFHNLDSK